MPSLPDFWQFDVLPSLREWRIVTCAAIVALVATPSYAQTSQPAAPAPIQQSASQALAASEAQATAFNAAQDAYPAASRAPRSRSTASPHVENNAPKDEAGGGVTGLGVTLYARNEQCFPTERRNLFSQVDQVIVGGETAPRPIDYAVAAPNGAGKVVPDAARQAIMGQNTWMLWGEGNEAFWGWVQENGYGIADFLILLDSRARNSRFTDSGLMNQPGMVERKTPMRGLGLYIDQGDGTHVTMTAPPDDIDAQTGKPAQRAKMPVDKHHPYKTFFAIGDEPLYEDAISQLADDGIDPLVYGYPSGVVGLRLMPNPDFFGNSKAAARARQYWQDQVVKDNGARYYSKDDPSVHADPNLIRPFRVSMACAFCHVGPHPLAPPPDVNHPGWGNMSSTIGDQYWTPSQIFSNLKQEDSFLWQFVASQQAGTIDTSLVATDHINNPNTINAIFELDARLARAGANPPEAQSEINLSLRGIEDKPLFTLNPRHTPRVLLDGADSVGVEAALLRVYLNIGAYSEQWRRVQNTIIGFIPQRPFDLDTIRAKSVYWNTTEHYRVSELEAFFTYVSKSGASATQPMKLDTTPEGQVRVAADQTAAKEGRNVFVQHCAVCHSSKQPADQTFTFSRDWRSSLSDKPTTLTMPMDFADWDTFKQSPAYAAYIKRLLAYLDTDPDHDLLKNNYLSTDIRIPITLVGTNSQRAVGTNGMRGQVWDNFSSDTYKTLPAVGVVHFFNPFKKTHGVDAWGNNDAYAPPGGGPGYYRPASLVSLWATAPLLHNNALGVYNRDPSVKGRLVAFDDAIDKLLNNRKRAPDIAATAHLSPADYAYPAPTVHKACVDHPETASAACSALHGDFRQAFAAAGVAGSPGFSDVGFIYRTTKDSYLDFRRPFIRPLLDGVLGPTVTSVASIYLWVVLVVVALLLAVFGNARVAGTLLALFAIATAALLRVSGFDTIWPWLWVLPLAALAATCAYFLFPDKRAWARGLFCASAVVFAITGTVTYLFVDGKLGDISLGPIPRGTPVNLLMNINPEAPPVDLFKAVSGLTRGIVRAKRVEHENDPSRPFAALAAFQDEAALPLLKASKCPDFVLDRGHWFAEALTDEEKRQLKAFLETL